MAVDSAIDEVVAGFDDCVDGLRAILKVLRDENAQLRAIVTEYRRLHGVTDEAVERAAVPVGTVPFERRAAPAALVLDTPPVAHRRVATVTKLCKECGGEMVGVLPTRNYCHVCLGKKATIRMKAWQDKKFATVVDDALTGVPV